MDYYIKTSLESHFPKITHNLNIDSRVDTIFILFSFSLCVFSTKAKAFKQVPSSSSSHRINFSKTNWIYICSASIMYFILFCIQIIIKRSDIHKQQQHTRGTRRIILKIWATHCLFILNILSSFYDAKKKNKLNFRSSFTAFSVFQELRIRGNASGASCEIE